MGAIVLGNTFRRRLGAVSGAMAALVAGTPAFAQQPEQVPEPPPQVEGPPVPAVEAPPVVQPPPEAPPPAPAGPSPEVKALLDAQQRQIDELSARLDDA